LSTETAYSIVAASPPKPTEYGGTRLPAFRNTNNSPGSVWVNSSGTIRESEQVMNNVDGFWPFANCSK
jgi:hypothetical protein